MLQDTKLLRPLGWHFRRAVTLALAALGGAGVGCGGAVSSDKAPESALSTLGDAEAQLTSAEAELQRSFGDRAAVGPAGDAAEPLDASPPRAPGAEPAPVRESGDPCEIACRALGSMRRAADRICTLSADRCDDATARLTRAERRVFDICPGCSA